jgi:Mg-chelatase subunit ChlD
MKEDGFEEGSSMYQSKTIIQPNSLMASTKKTETLYYTYIAMTMSKGVDILLILDLTGSMSSSIQMAKKTIFNIVKFIKDQY